LSSEVLRRFAITAPFRDLSEGGAHDNLKPRDPDALANPPNAHEVHPVIPVAATHEREAMRTKLPAVVQGAEAVPIKGVCLIRNLGEKIGFRLVRCERPTAQEGNDFIKDFRVAGHGHVACDRQWQPEEVIRKPRTNATTRVWTPPVLNVPVRKLTGGGAKNMAASLSWFDVKQRHHVLKLVSKAIGT